MISNPTNPSVFKSFFFLFFNLTNSGKMKQRKFRKKAKSLINCNASKNNCLSDTITLKAYKVEAENLIHQKKKKISQSPLKFFFL